MQYQDYYKIPVISRDATVEEIKKSFRKLVRKYYLDVSHEKTRRVGRRKLIRLTPYGPIRKSLPPMPALPTATNSYMAGVRVSLLK